MPRRSRQAVGGPNSSSSDLARPQEIVARAVAAASQLDDGKDTRAVRMRGLRSQARLVALVEAGEAAQAEAHWAEHMAVVGRVLLARRARTVIDLIQHDY